MAGYFYLLGPVLGYLSAGSLKFAINFFRHGQDGAARFIGLGGFPSTHSTIVATPVALIALQEGLESPLLGLGLALLLVVAIDAMDLRRKVGRHAAILRRGFPADAEAQALRLRMGHSLIEVLGGWVLGACLAWGLVAAAKLPGA